MKKTAFAVIIGLIILSLALFAGASSPADGCAWTLLPNTEVKAEASYASATVTTIIQQNESVTTIGDPVVDADGKSWLLIKCYDEHNQEVRGYVPHNMLYFTSQSTTENVRIVKINPNGMGKTVPLYKVIGGEAVLELQDGRNVMLLSSVSTVEGYSYVEYEGNNYYVKTEYITDSLTYNQILAIIIAAVIVAVAAAFIIIISVYRKRIMNK